MRYQVRTTIYCSHDIRAILHHHQHEKPLVMITCVITEYFYLQKIKDGIALSKQVHIYALISLPQTLFEHIYFKNSCLYIYNLGEMHKLGWFYKRLFFSILEGGHKNLLSIKLNYYIFASRSFAQNFRTLCHFSVTYRHKHNN